MHTQTHIHTHTHTHACTHTNTHSILTEICLSSREVLLLKQMRYRKRFERGCSRRISETTRELFQVHRPWKEKLFVHSGWFWMLEVNKSYNPRKSTVDKKGPTCKKSARNWSSTSDHCNYYPLMWHVPENLPNHARHSPRPHGLTFIWWGCCSLCLWHKPAELAHSFLFCSCVCFCLCGPFNCISFHKFSRKLSTFSLCSSSLISALLVFSTIYLFMKVSLSSDIILCGWLAESFFLVS